MNRGGVILTFPRQLYRAVNTDARRLVENEAKLGSI
jgi:hypothetical protein